MSTAFVAVSAIAPSLLLMWFFHRRDIFPEPPKVLWTTFALGIAIVVPVLFFAWPMDFIANGIRSPLLYGLFTAFFVAAIPEEIFKFLVLWKYSARHDAFDEPMDGIVYGVAASLGFATFENILYVADGGTPVAILRAFTAVPGHAFLGAIMGYLFSRAHFGDGDPSRRWWFKALAIPILLHGVYDTPLLAAGHVGDGEAGTLLTLLILGVPVLLIAEGVWAVRLAKRLHLDQHRIPPPPPAAEPLPVSEPTPAAALMPAVGPPTAVVPPTSALPSEHRPTTEARPAETAPAPSRLIAWLLTLGGGLAAGLGGVVTLGVLAGLFFLGPGDEDVGSLLLGTVLIGVLPSIFGVWAFAAGIRRLNRLTAAGFRV